MSNLSELLPSGGGQNQVEFVASGTLPNGQAVILNSDGTITAAGMVPTSIPEAIPSGSQYDFNPGQSAYPPSVSFDPNTAGKFVVAYPDYSNSNYGTAVIGTVSGTTLSFGAEYVYNSASSASASVAFDPNTAGKFVVTYGYSAANAVVGTVSGTSISFGSATTFNSNTSMLSRGISFDPNTAGKFVVVYQDASNSGYGTAIAGTISGTSVSFGSEYVYSTTNTNFNTVAFDPNTAGKFVVTFIDMTGGANYGKARVGTVSGTTISYGSVATFNSADTRDISMSFDPSTSGNLVVAYRDYSSTYGEAIIGAVSGTSITFGSQYVFISSAIDWTAVAFDPSTANKFIVESTGSTVLLATVGTVSGTTISYGTANTLYTSSPSSPTVAFEPNGDGRFVTCYNRYAGRAILGQMTATVQATNLTSTNLIGISAEAASSGATAKINTWGGINEAQSSLTIASDYYVQTDGTITTATGGQKVGQAISATTINMRNQP